ncbi:hypothetical protein [Gossypium barbadense]|uniref:Uncharacterized protein n=2 Tax=Gossypium TaxID=3633 RepID=A0A5J5NDE4_GOSBA|nr:hypothetical protein ES319_1Z159700v1 [Gossypium barbadense]KAB1670945.1 hypothetical protein [Gossypium barbadense]KJB27366.1 hypothetical protein B456_004G294100 [Gossypium raimondii]
MAPSGINGVGNRYRCICILFQVQDVSDSLLLYYGALLLGIYLRLSHLLVSKYNMLKCVICYSVRSNNL